MILGPIGLGVSDILKHRDLLLEEAVKLICDRVLMFSGVVKLELLLDKACLCDGWGLGAEALEERLLEKIQVVALKL